MPNKFKRRGSFMGSHQEIRPGGGDFREWRHIQRHGVSEQADLRKEHM